MISSIVGDLHLEEGLSMSPGSMSFAARFLAGRADLREQIRQDDAFRKWRDQFRTVVVDDEPFFVMGGDMLRDEDELVLEWARRRGLVSAAEIDAFHDERK